MKFGNGRTSFLLPVSVIGGANFPWVKCCSSWCYFTFLPTRTSSISGFMGLNMNSAPTLESFPHMGVLYPSCRACSCLCACCSMAWRENKQVFISSIARSWQCVIMPAPAATGCLLAWQNEVRSLSSGLMVLNCIWLSTIMGRLWLFVSRQAIVMTAHPFNPWSRNYKENCLVTGAISDKNCFRNYGKTLSISSPEYAKTWKIISCNFLTRYYYERDLSSKQSSINSNPKWGLNMSCHRSPTNAFVHVISCLVAYSLGKNKPKINVSYP